MITPFKEHALTALRDREEAGHLLADKLTNYRDDPQTVILALPRGGVKVSFIMHQALRLPLDVFITRKLGFPGNPEYALGAVAETGFVWLNYEATRLLELAEAKLHNYLDREIERQKEEISRQQTMYRKGHSLPPLVGRTVILVDDGVATGSTFMASLHALRALQVSRIIAALPVGPLGNMQKIASLVDQLEVLLTPDPFQAVGNHYIDFSQVEDSEVIAELETARCSSFDREVKV